MSVVEVLECGHAESPHSDFTRGYGTDRDGSRHCYDCCAERERVAMIETGRATLYLTAPESGLPNFKPQNGMRHELTDWPGKLRFLVGYIRKGRHNIAGVRYDGHFWGPDGKRWRFTQYGNNTQIAHCKRLKVAA